MPLAKIIDLCNRVSKNPIWSLQRSLSVVEAPVEDGPRRTTFSLRKTVITSSVVRQQRAFRLRSRTVIGYCITVSKVLFQASEMVFTHSGKLLSLHRQAVPFIRILKSAEQEPLWSFIA